MTLPLELPESVQQYRLVTTTDDLQDLCQQAVKCGWFAIDSEFVRERTYYAQLGLLQIHANGTTAVIDAGTAILDRLKDMIGNEVTTDDIGPFEYGGEQYNWTNR